MTLYYSGLKISEKFVVFIFLPESILNELQLEYLFRFVSRSNHAGGLSSKNKLPSNQPSIQTTHNESTPVFMHKKE